MSSMTAAVPGRYIGVIPSHLLVCASLSGLTNVPRMIKAADPMFWVRGLWGSWPVWLDRIPRRMRTHSTTASGGDTGRVGVLLAGVLLAGGVLAGLLPGENRLADRVGGVCEEDGTWTRRQARARVENRGSRRTADRRLHRARVEAGHGATQQRGARAGQRARRRRGFGRRGEAQHPGHLLLCSIG